MNALQKEKRDVNEKEFGNGMLEIEEMYVERVSTRSNIMVLKKPIHNLRKLKHQDKAIE